MSLRIKDIKIPYFSTDQIVQFHVSQVWLQLTKLKTNKATVRGDLPARLIKEFAAYWSERSACASAEVAIKLGIIFLSPLSPLSSELSAQSPRKSYRRIFKFCMGS